MMDEKIFEIFDDLLKLGQIVHEFDFPGKEQTHHIKMGALWEQDLIRVKNRAARRTIAHDDSTRREIEILETLVESILAIDSTEFTHADPGLYEETKGKLRMILEHSSPHVIVKLYEEYIQLLIRSSEEIGGRIEEIKKSSEPSQTKDEDEIALQ